MPDLLPALNTPLFPDEAQRLEIAAAAEGVALTWARISIAEMMADNFSWPSHLQPRPDSIASRPQ